MEEQNEPMYQTMSFNIESAQARRLRELHDATHLSLSDMARAAFRDWLSKQRSRNGDR